MWENHDIIIVNSILYIHSWIVDYVYSKVKTKILVFVLFKQVTTEIANFERVNIFKYFTTRIKIFYFLLFK